MIFTSLAFLLLAAVVLVAAALKGSLALAAVALGLSLVASVVLAVGWSVYRRGLGAVAADEPAAPTAPAVAGPASPAGPPVVGYPDLTAAQAVRVVEGLNFDELHDLRRYEVEHAARATVLKAIDTRIEVLAAVRRDLAASRL